MMQENRISYTYTRNIQKHNTPWLYTCQKVVEQGTLDDAREWYILHKCAKYTSIIRLGFYSYQKVVDQVTLGDAGKWYILHMCTRNTCILCLDYTRSS